MSTSPIAQPPFLGDDLEALREELLGGHRPQAERIISHEEEIANIKKANEVAKSRSKDLEQYAMIIKEHNQRLDAEIAIQKESTPGLIKNLVKKELKELQGKIFCMTLISTLIGIIAALALLYLTDIIHFKI